MKLQKPTTKTSKPSKRPKGRVTGLSIKDFWVKMFQENESKKLPDTELTKKARAEFPGRGKVVFDAVATVRSRYNHGVMTGGKKPSTQSNPYNKQPKPAKAKKKSA